MKLSIVFKIYFSDNINPSIENLTERLPVGVLNQRSPNLFEPGELMVTNGIIELIEVRKVDLLVANMNKKLYNLFATFDNFS